MPIVSRPFELGDLVDPHVAMAAVAGPQAAPVLPEAPQRTVNMGSFGAAFRSGPAVSVLNYVNRAMMDEDPDFVHPWDTLDPKYDPIAPQLAEAKSKEEWYALKGQYDRKLNDQAYMDQQSLSGYAAYMAGAMTDPIVLGLAIATAPFGGGATVWGSAAKTGAIVAGEVTAAEAILQATDPFRTYDESLTSIAAGGVLGGVFGLVGHGIGKLLTPRQMSETEQVIRDQLHSQFVEARARNAPDDVAPEIRATVEVGDEVTVVNGAPGAVARSIDERASRQTEIFKEVESEDGILTYELDEEATAAAREAEKTVRTTVDIDGEEKVFEGTPEEVAEKLRELDAFLQSERYFRDPDTPGGVGADAMEFTTVKDETPFATPTRAHQEVVQSPLTRLLYNGKSATASRLVDYLVRHNFLKPTHFNGKAPLTRKSHGTLQDEVEFAQKTFFRVMGDMTQEAKTTLRGRKIKMSAAEIAEEAGKAARRGDTHNIPEIANIAKEFRRFMKEWGQRAYDQGLLSKEALDNVDKYFPRIYDLKKILRHWSRWEDVISRHFARKYPELDAEELVAIADDIYDTLSKTQIGRPFPTSVRPRSTTLKSGHLKGRTLDLEDIDLEDFLIDDIRTISHRYMRGVAPDVLIREIFGKDNIIVDEGVPLPREFIDQIKSEFALHIEKAKADGNMREVKNLGQQRKKVFQDIMFTISEITGHGSPSVNSIRGLSLDFARSPQARKYLGGIRGYTAVSALGNLVFSALPDVANSVLYNGLRNIIRSAPRIALPKKFSGEAKRYLRSMNVGLDRLDHSRMAKIADIEEFGLEQSVWRDASANILQKVKESLSGQNVAHYGFQAIGANVWNAIVKSVDGMAFQNKFLRDAGRWGKLSKMEKAMYARLGVDEDFAKKVDAAFKAQSTKTDAGSRYADLDSWEPSVASKFQRVIFRESEQQVVMPQAWERPISLNNEIGGFVNQFKGFIQSHVLQHLANAGQRLLKGDALALEFIVTAWGLAIMSDYIKELIRHDFDTDAVNDMMDERTLQQWIYRGIDRGALNGMGSDLFLALNKWSEGKLAQSMGLNEQKAYRSYGLGLEYTVPGIGWLARASKGVGDIGQEMLGISEFTAKDLHNIRSLLPLQNLFYLSWLFDTLEERTAEALELPEQSGGRKETL